MIGKKITLSTKSVFLAVLLFYLTASLVLPEWKWVLYVLGIMGVELNHEF